MKEDTLDFCLHQLTLAHARGDYAEFLKLIVIYLGGTPPGGIKFSPPGAFHHARWMAKAIYSLKIYLFRDIFLLSEEDLDGLRDVTIFLVRVYVHNWFQASQPCKAPQLDLNLLKDLHFYSELDKEVSEVTLKKFCRHLWYLSDETVALSFFDENVPTNIKNKMASVFFNREPVNEAEHKATIKPDDIALFQGHEISDFVTQNTKKFFFRFNLSTDFLKIDAKRIYTEKSNLAPAANP